ncbi:MAG: beta-galactosidase, partial [Victivallales bacterium]|nr:beta-galactosidase [Victivallales bacterium]
QWKGRQAGHAFLKASVISADYREMCIDFMKNALPIIAKSKALAAIDLANEVQLEDYSPLMQQRFRIWLTGKYGTIQALNQAWKTRYADFSAIFMVRPMVFDRSAHQRFMDWVNFNKEIGTEHFRFLCQLARQHAPGVPLHIKTLPHEFGMPWYEFGSNSRNFYDYADGVDRREFTAMTEIIGTDSWADNPHDRYGRLATDLPYQSAYFSYLRGLNPGKWIFDSEWHIIRTDPPVTPHKCLDMVMTQNFVQGLRAGTFWVASPGIYQKLDLTSQPRLLLQAGMTTARLRSQSRYYDKLARRERPVGILYSPRSRYLDRDRHTMSLLRLSEAALFTGVSYKLVDSRDAAALKPGSLKCLLVPECLEPEAETRDALAGFAAAGGKVVFTGSFAGRTPEAAAAEFKGRALPLPEDPRTILPLLTGLFADADLMPEIRVTDGNGKPVFGIEWHTVPAAGGNLLYITNMNKKACRLRISSPRGAIVDLNTDGTVPGEILLNTWDTFLGIIKN